MGDVWIVLYPTCPCYNLNFSDELCTRSKMTVLSNGIYCDVTSLIAS